MNFLVQEPFKFRYLTSFMSDCFLFHSRLTLGGSLDFLYFEDRNRFVEYFGAVLADHLEYMSGEVPAASAVPFGRADTFSLLVEKPLIYFDPLKTGHGDSFSLCFGTHLTSILGVYLLENDKLVLGLVHAHRILITPSLHLALTFSGDCGSG